MTVQRALNCHALLNKGRFQADLIFHVVLKANLFTLFAQNLKFVLA